MIDDLPKKVDLETRITALVAKLVSLISPHGETIAWIGSGLSIGCGYPDWEKAVVELCEACIPDKADIPPSSLASDLLDWTQRCKDADPNQYTNTLARLFGKVPISIRSAYSSICGCPFRYVVTTNFDRCLEITRGMRMVLAYPDLNLVKYRAPHQVVYLHGKVRAPSEATAEDLLFTAKELDDAYTNSFVTSALHLLLGGFPTIFVGCGLREAVLKNLFKHLRDIHRHTRILPQQKLILLADEPDNEKRDRQDREMNELGISIERYPLDHDGGSQNRYRYLDEIWARVREEMSQSMQSQMLNGGTI